MIKRRILVYCLLSILLISVFSISVFNYQSTRKYISAAVERETSELLSSFTAEAKRYSNERVVELELIAGHLALLPNNKNEIVSFLHVQNNKMPFFTGLGFITLEGEIFAADGSRIPVKQRESFKKALSGETVFSEIFPLYQDSAQKVTAISIPVHKDGEIIGVLSGVVNMANIIGGLYEESRLPGTVFLLKGGEVVFSSSSEREIEDVIPNVETLLKEIDQLDVGNWLINSNSAHYVMYQHIWDDWIVVVDSNANPDTKTISDTFWRNTLFVLITLFVIILVLLYVHQLELREKNMLKRDLLTGLGNRTQLEEDLEFQLQHFPQKKFALLFICLDRFIEINERVGYQMGDRIVFALSKKLKQIASKENLYRVDGDEFVFISYTETEQEQRSIASKIVHLMEVPIPINKEGSVWVTVSVGVRSSLECDEADLMMQDATFAVQEAKRKGGNQFVYFTAQLAILNERHRQVANHLDSALENKEFYLVYQPIYRFSSQSVVSFETLLRWKSPILGEVGPVDFIPLLEENDLIIQTGRWLIREVASQVIRWEKEGYKTFVVTLNVSVKQLLHPNFLSDVYSIIKETGVKPEMLVFEITESIVVQNIELASQILLTLNSLGIQTALDDFGTGYSSFSILKTLPIQYLKIDRAFVVEIESDGGVSKKILKGIVDIANGLNLTTVVEGVETNEQLAILKEMGVHRVQGYIISKPVIPEAAIQMVEGKR
ncbi:EAL domain-containing protein [Bacillus sp. Bva_UNVM-123]|uniref:bifunctional diguanylate cyclase/phosphodiesterase n=1 Tax=Bacillus sp. Bva_UNVM-123 TaxID=2829798 RepID=UPI00391FBB43